MTHDAPAYGLWSLVVLNSAVLLTLAMFPVLVLMYGRLAASEEVEMRSRFGEAFDRYARHTPRFVPSLRSMRDRGTTRV